MVCSNTGTTQTPRRQPGSTPSPTSPRYSCFWRRVCVLARSACGKPPQIVRQPTWVTSAHRKKWRFSFQKSALKSGPTTNQDDWVHGGVGALAGFSPETATRHSRYHCVFLGTLHCVLLPTILQNIPFLLLFPVSGERTRPYPLLKNCRAVRTKGDWYETLYDWYETLYWAHGRRAL